MKYFEEKNKYRTKVVWPRLVQFGSATKCGTDEGDLTEHRNGFDIGCLLSLKHAAHDHGLAGPDDHAGVERLGPRFRKANFKGVSS